MFIAYAILKLSRSKMKLCIFKNFADKNDSPPSVAPPPPPPPPPYHNRVKQAVVRISTGAFYIPHNTK